MTESYVPSDKVLLPPADANVHTTACDYCIVGCGYKVYTWPIGRDGTPTDNALGSDFPGGILRPWVSPNQLNVVKVDGVDHNVAVLPDFDAKVVNTGGNHSIRGGTLALKCHNSEGPTRDRLTSPMVRVNGKLTEVDWDTAIGAMADVSRHVIDRFGESAWAMKTFSYEFFENTYAISKLAFGAVKTPAYSPHDKPGAGADTAGVDDAGLITFNTSYEDWRSAEVLFLSGADPFETKTILFTQWIMAGGAKLIMVLPRRSAGVAYAEARGGLFLQVTPGTDALLHLAISRIIVENGWEDTEFIEKWMASSWEIGAGMGRGTRNTPWQWRTTWGKIGAESFDDYKQWLLDQDESDLSYAAKGTGVPAEKIEQAAEMITGGGGPRPKASFGLEKGNYWSNNYLNTASFSAMGLLAGAGNRPGRFISRMGGHQRGWIGAASYPRDKSPEKLPGRRKVEMDLDRWVEAGKVRFAWVIGTTWTGAMAASQELASRIREMTVGNPNQVQALDRQSIADALIRRVDSGGMVIVDSDIYPVAPVGTEFADIVLPAAAWGEHDAARCNGERRLRLYSKFYDPPGESKPDWWAVARFAREIGYEGFDWETDNDVFEEAARSSRGGVLDYNALVWKARRDGQAGHEALRDLGTTGIQCPIRYEDGELVGTKRLHDSTLELGDPEGPTLHPKWLTNFKSHSGKALFIKSPWALFSDFYERITPDPEKGEYWVTNGRINEVWQSAFDDVRKPYIVQRWPDTFVEIHPDDAAANGIESGDMVRLVNDDVLIQVGGFNRVKAEELSFTWMLENGRIRIGRGEAEAVAIVLDSVRPGLLFTNFLHPGSPANSLVHRVPDPITNRYRFKLGKATITRIGESPYKHAMDKMSFMPRDIV